MFRGKLITDDAVISLVSKILGLADLNNKVLNCTKLKWMVLIKNKIRAFFMNIAQGLCYFFSFQEFSG